MTSPYDFEYPLAVLSADQSQIGRDNFIRSVIQARKNKDPDIYDKILMSGTKYAALLISLSIILLVFLFLYAFFTKNSDQRVMVYGTIGVIGMLISSGIMT